MCLSPSCYHGMHAFRGCWRRMMERARVSDCVEWSHLPTCPDCFETVLGEGDQLTSLNPWCRYEGISLLQQLGLYPILTIAWRRQWHPTQALLPGKSHGGRAWWAAVHGVAKSRTRLSNFTFTFHFHALEKEMAAHSSVLAWGIPGTEEPGGLPSMGSHRVGHCWSDLAAAAADHSLYAFLLRYMCIL